MKNKYIIEELKVLGYNDLSLVLSKFSIEDEMNDLKLSDDEKEKVQNLVDKLKNDSLENVMMVIRHRNEKDIVDLINKFESKFHDAIEYGYCNASSYINDIDQLREVLLWNLKSREGWNVDGSMLDEYLKVGDPVSITMYDYFIEVLPPKTFRSDVVQMGEAYDHDPETGKAVYPTLEKKGSRRWVYTGNKVKQ